MQIHDTNGHLKHDDEWSKKNSWPINVDKKNDFNYRAISFMRCLHGLLANMLLSQNSTIDLVRHL